MLLVVAPAMLNYLKHLRLHGIAYHVTMDQLDFCFTGEARDHQFVSMTSELQVVGLLRAFYAQDIVGIRFDNVCRMALALDRDVTTIVSSSSLLSLVESWTQDPRYQKNESEVKQKDLHAFEFAKRTFAVEIPLPREIQKCLHEGYAELSPHTASAPLSNTQH